MEHDVINPNTAKKLVKVGTVVGIATALPLAFLSFTTAIDNVRFGDEFVETHKKAHYETTLNADLKAIDDYKTVQMFLNSLPNDKEENADTLYKHYTHEARMDAANAHAEQKKSKLMGGWHGKVVQGAVASFSGILFGLTAAKKTGDWGYTQAVKVNEYARRRRARKESTRGR